MSARKIWMSAMLVLLGYSSFTQTLSPSVLPATGGFGTVGNMQLQYTIGEPLNSTFNNGGTEVSLGFEQPELNLSVDSIRSNSFCTSDSIRVYFTARGIYGPTNLFTLQLSNSAGSFSAPFNLISFSATVSGSASAFIPVGILAGTNYKVRIISSYPKFEGASKSVTIHAPLGVASPVDTTIWSGYSVTLFGNEGVAYNWPSLGTDSPTVTITPPSSDTSFYSVVITDTYGCKDTNNIIVITTDTLIINLFNIGDTLTLGDSTNIQITANLPETVFTWHRDNTTNVSGDTSGSGPFIKQLLTNNTNDYQAVNYTISASNGSYIILVYGTLFEGPQHAAHVSVTTNYTNKTLSACHDTLVIADTLVRSGGFGNYLLQQTLPPGAHVLAVDTSSGVRDSLSTSGSYVIVTWIVPNTVDTMCILKLLVFFDCSAGDTSTALSTAIVPDTLTISNINSSIGLSFEIPSITETAPILQPQYALIGNPIKRIWKVCANRGKVDNLTLTYSPENEIQPSGETLVVSSDSLVSGNHYTFSVTPILDSFVIHLSPDSLDYLKGEAYLDGDSLSKACLYLIETSIAHSCSDTIPSLTGLRTSSNCSRGDSCFGSSILQQGNVIVSDDYNEVANIDNSEIQLAYFLIQQGDSAGANYIVNPCSSDSITIVYAFKNPTRSNNLLAPNANFKSLNYFTVYIDPLWFNTANMTVRIANDSGANAAYVNYNYNSGLLGVDFAILGNKLKNVINEGDTVFGNLAPYTGDSSYNEMNENTEFTIIIGGLFFNQNSPYLSSCSVSNGSYILGSAAGVHLDYVTMCDYRKDLYYQHYDYSNNLDMIMVGQATPQSVAENIPDTLSFCWEQYAGSGDPWIFTSDSPVKDSLLTCKHPFYEVKLTVPDNFTLDTNTLSFTPSLGSTFHISQLTVIDSPGFLLYTLKDTFLTNSGCLNAIAVFNGLGCSGLGGQSGIGVQLLQGCDKTTCSSDFFCMGNYVDQISFHCNGGCSGTGIGMGEFSADTPILVERIPVDSEWLHTGPRNLGYAYPCDEISVQIIAETFGTTGHHADSMFMQLTYDSLAGPNPMFSPDSGFYTMDTVAPVTWIALPLSNVSRPFADSAKWAVNVYLPSGCDTNTSVSAALENHSHVFFVKLKMKVRCDLPSYINHGVYPVQNVVANMEFINCDTGQTFYSCDAWGGHITLISHAYSQEIAYLSPADGAYPYADICHQRIVLRTFATGGLPQSIEMPNELRPLIVWPDTITFAGLSGAMNFVSASFQYPSNLSPRISVCGTCHTDTLGTVKITGLYSDSSYSWPRFSQDSGSYYMELLTEFDKLTCGNISMPTDLYFNYWTRGPSGDSLSIQQYLAAHAGQDTVVPTLPTFDDVKMSFASNNSYIFPNDTIRADSTTFTFNAQLTFNGSHPGTGYTWIYPILPPQIASIKIATTSPLDTTQLGDTVYYFSGSTGTRNIKFIATLDTAHRGEGCLYGSYIIAFATGYTCNPNTNGLPYGVHFPPSNTLSNVDSLTCGVETSYLYVVVDSPTIIQSNLDTLNAVGGNCAPYEFIYNITAQNGAVYNPDCIITVPPHVRLTSLTLHLTCNDSAQVTISNIDTTNVNYNCSSLIKALLDSAGFGYLPLSCSIAVTAHFTGSDSIYSGICNVIFKSTGNNFCGNSPILRTLTATIKVTSLSVTLAPNVCSGTGKVIAAVTGGSLPYSYNWNGPHNLDTLNVSTSNTGLFVFTVTDTFGCVSRDSIYISNQDTTVFITAVYDTGSTCFQANNASIRIIIHGGILPYVYKWNNLTIDTNYRNHLSPATYAIIVRDQLGCIVDTSIHLGEPLPILISPHIKGTCYGDSIGVIRITLNNGVAPYAYTWNTGSSNDSISNLYAGSYRITVTDIVGCTASASYTILEPAPMFVSLAIGDSICFNAHTGYVNLTESGGTIPYHYNWSNGSTLKNVIGLSAQEYHVTVTDINGCSVVDSAQINQYNALTIFTEISQPSCPENNNGSLSESVTGGKPPFIYVWQNHDTITVRNNLGIGIYSVTVVDAAGCKDTDSVSLTMNYLTCCFYDTVPGSEFMYIDTNAHSSFLSIPPGEDIYIGDSVTLTVNSNLTLQQCEVILGAGAEIIITGEDTLKIMGSYLHGCDTMWKGIIQEGGAFITDKYGSKRSRIQDAVAALTNSAGGYADHIRYTDFYRNQKNLSFELFDAPDLDISACNFGMGGYTNMLPVPHGYTNTNRPLYGIDIVYTGDIAIPNPTYSGVADTFQNMNAGIVTLGSFANIYDNVFDSIYDYENNGLPNGSAISATGYTAFGDPSALGGLLVQTNTTAPDTASLPKFKNCNIAVCAYSQSATVNYNRMENVTYGVYTNSCQAASTINVHANYINNTAFGVSLLNNSSARQLIDYNTIYVYPVVEHYGYNGMGWVFINNDIFWDSTYAHIYAKTYGVEETEVTSSATTIKHNTIYRGLNSIELNNTVNTQVADNYLHLANDSAVKGNQAGLYAANCHNLLVSKDTVDGDGATYLGAPDTLSLVVTRFRKAGISLYNTYTGNLCNNILAGSTSTAGLGYGMLCAGNCNGVQVYSNTMQASGYGLTLLSSGTGTVIPYQGGFNVTYQNNDFPGPFTYTDGTYSYIHVNDSLSYLRPIFYYLSGQAGTSYVSDYNSSYPSGEQIIFLSQPKDSTEFCERITLPGPQGGNGFARALAVDSGQYYMVPGIDSIAANWLAEKTLYESLYGDTAVLNHDTMMASFYAHIDSSDRGVIFRSELQNQILTDSATLADSTGSAGKPSGYADALSSAEYLNNHIPTGNIQAANYKAMSNIYLQMKAAGINTFTSGQIDTIKRLAIQCPYLAGDAVYLARSLYSQIDNTVFFNDLNICQPLPDGSYRSLAFTPPADTAIVVTITPLEFVHLYPNPAKNIINLNFNAQTVGSVQFELIDPLGQPVIKQYLGGQTSVQFSTGSVSNGLYYWSLSDSKRTIQAGKVAIMK